MGEIATRTLEVARQLVPAASDDASVRGILTAEIRRRMNRYELLDRRFRQKYGMHFEEFHDRHVVEEQGYNFEVESDYCDWEMAVTSLAALEEQLSKLEVDGRGQDR
jgi:hypothetical protein